MKVVYTEAALGDLDDILTFYRVSDDAVEILHIQHARRKPPGF